MWPITLKKSSCFLIASCSLIFLYSCQTGTDQEANDGTRVNGPQTFVDKAGKGFAKFGDAAEFLPSWSTVNTLVFHIE